MSLMLRSLARISVLAVFTACAVGCATLSFAEDKQITLKIPKRSNLTPVQELNRDGVKAIQKHDYDKAKKLFYRAYLIDPDDPFTLNNLGYISELEGDVERASRYYDLAAQHTSDAIVDKSDNARLEGKPVAKVTGANASEDARMQLNRLNVQAVNLLMKDRAPEADVLLQNALKLAPNDPFTLNNMGHAKEKEGDYEAALSYYTAAARLESRDRIVVSINEDWRGKPISEIAEENVDKLRKLMRKAETRQARVARLNLQGVSAINRNERNAARGYFEQAYRIDPTDAFTLNNMGYLSEIDGDRETAQFYYEKAIEARRSGAKITVATRRDAEGERLYDVADISQQKVESRMQAEADSRRRAGASAVLKTRDNRRVVEPTVRPQPQSPPQQAQPIPQIEEREPDQNLDVPNPEDPTERE